MACSSMLIVMRSEDLLVMCFNVLRTIHSNHPIQCHNLSSGKHAQHSVKQAPTRTVQSQSVGMMFLIGD